MKDLTSILHSGNYSCVISNNGTVRTFTRRGVNDLYDIYLNEPELLAGADIADKVVGKGAASLMVLGKIKNLYADVISEPARQMLSDNGISLTFREVVPYIINRDKSGMCPLETKTRNSKSATEAFPLIKDFVENLRKGKSFATTMAVTLLICTSAAKVNAQNDTLPGNGKYPLDEVVVTGTRNETDPRHLPMTVSVVGRQELEASYQPSILQTLTEQVPGLFVTSRGIMGYGVSTGAAGGISMRGLSGNAQMLVLIDGHPQYMGLFGHPIADSYQSMLADKVEVLRGPASVIYGSNAMGGVINIVTRKMRYDGSDTDINVGLGSFMTLQSEVTNRVKKGRFTSTVSASYNRTDGHRPNMEFEQYGGYARFGYDINDNWDIYADVNVTHFNASNPGSVTNPMIDNDQKVTRGMASMSLSNDYGRTSGAVSVYYNWGRHEINDGHTAAQAPQTSLFNSKDLMMGVSWYQSASLFEGNRVTFGFDYQHFGGRTWNEAIATHDQTQGVDRTENELAGYIDFRQSIGNWLTLDAGVRVDHHSLTKTEVIPQGGLSFHLPRCIELKAMVSKGFRNPTIRELYMFAPRNPELKPERIINYEISLSQQMLNGALSYGANIFYINGDNAIILDSSIPRYLNTGKISNIGVESNINYHIDRHWTVNANYSYVHMDNPVLASPEHKLDINAIYSSGPWTITSGLQYVNGFYTAVENNETTEDFVLWNLRGSYRACKFVTLFLKGENLLGQHYETMLGYPMPRATVMGGIKINI